MKKFWIITGIVLFVLLIVAIIIYKNRKGKQAMSKGGKNNPGNIRNTSIKWGGETTKAGETFESFDTLQNGIKAMYQNLITYRSRYSLTTIHDIIYRWANPKDGNNTEGYISRVENTTGINRNQQLAVSDYPSVISAMSKVEATFPVSIDQVKNAIS